MLSPTGKEAESSFAEQEETSLSFELFFKQETWAGLKKIKALFKSGFKV